MYQQSSRLPCKIFIIDDDPDDVLVMRRALAKAARVTASEANISVASDGESALVSLREKVSAGDWPDLVLVDLNMPGLTGFDLLQICREDAVLKQLRLIVVTTASDEDSFAKARRYGADDVFSKPETLKDMTRLLETLL
ncbi:response regulator [Coralliovum pocilloporae]|uniref:response regulator n=1 Tax=Coralliovum pocilloporae TaxID=3066369 RepID=UPI003306B66C